MNSSAALASSPGKAPVAGLLSLIVPGAGQFYLNQRGRGLGILATMGMLAYLVNWGLDFAKIAQVDVGGVTSSWLWFGVALLWMWNVFDAVRSARGNAAFNFPWLLIAAAMVFFIAWQVTNVNLDRLVTRFQDAVTVANQLIHPDLVTTDATGATILSDNAAAIIGRVQPGPAPTWLVQLGIVAQGTLVPTFKAGTLIETIAIGLLATIFSTILAVPFSFLAAHNIMSRVPGGAVVYYVMRMVLNIVRAVDPIIWGLLLIVWLGLGNFAGIVALSIHSVAALAKLYSEEVEHIDPGPIEALTATGANLLQVIRYAVIPQIIPPFLGYTLLRWDINMRMATIIGFVAGGGIGFFVLETIRKGAYNQYAAALWAVAIVIIIVDYVSAYWRQRILVGETSAPQKAKTAQGALQPAVARDSGVVGMTEVAASPRRPFYKSLRTIIYIILGVWAFLYCWTVTGIDIRTLFDPAPTFARLIHDFLSIDLTPDIVEIIVNQMLVTVFQALLATTLGGLIAIPFSFLAAKNLTGRSRLSLWVYFVTRFVFDVLRSIEALLYVAIFVFWVGIGSFAGTLALAITTFALIGKLFADAIENIDTGPMEAVTATGATRLQAIVYAILPQIIPPFVSYSIYQWDINVRMATIIGFAGGGGIGLLLSTYFGQLQYHKAGTVVGLIVIIVALMDFASAKIRERMV